MANCAITFCTLTITILVFGQLFAVKPSAATGSQPSRQCLQCICEASSGCKLNLKCHNTGTGYYCGPYQISWAYWADGGKPGFTGAANDFENCLVNKNCAEDTVRGYMAKWGSDCDGNGVTDCFDYAAIHKTGPGACNQQWLLESKYWRDFQQCYGAGGGGAASSGQYEPAPAAVPGSWAISSASVSSTPNRRIANELPKPLPLPPRPTSNQHGHTASAFYAPGAVSTTYSTSSREVEITHEEEERRESASFSSTSGNRVAPQPAPPSSQPRLIYKPFTPVVATSSSAYSSSAPRTPSNQPSSSSNTVWSNAPRPNPQPSAPTWSPPAPRVNALPALPPPPPTWNTQPRPAPAPAAYQPLPPSPPSSQPKPLANFNPIVQAECLNCLCHASSKCNVNKGCDGNYCGPYLLSWGFWHDGGSPGGNYAQCTTNISCAEIAVQGYMNKWAKDCDGDGAVDCDDFALIHKLGPHGCGNSAAIDGTDYWKQYTTCRGSASFENIPTGNAPPPPKPIESEVTYEEAGSTLNEPPSPPAPESGNPANVRITFNNRDVVNTHNTQPSTSTEVPFVDEIPPANDDYYGINSRTNEDNSAPSESNAADSANSNNKPVYNPFTNTGGSLPEVRTGNVTDGDNSLVPQACLECICHASSRCNAAIGCISDASLKLLCGPFQVDMDYWVEAGKPGQRADLSNAENFQQCLTTRECADETVRGYMARLHKDCDQSGTIDCYDMAALHFAGPSQCNAQWYLDSQYYADFRGCYEFRRRR